MAKIVIIGAGSGFGSRLSIDILSRPSLKDSTIALCDIDSQRLEQVRGYVQRAIDGHDLPGHVIAATDREQLLPGADCVVTAVSIGGPAYWGEPYRSEVEIPRKYGIEPTVADTIGVGGVFRFLRTAHEHLQFARDMERLCPQALMLNYTNPMCMLTWLHSVGSSIENVGLCHSVQGTTKKLATPWVHRTTRSVTPSPASTIRPGSCDCVITGKTSTRSCDRRSKATNPSPRIRCGWR